MKKGSRFSQLLSLYVYGNGTDRGETQIGMNFSESLDAANHLLIKSEFLVKGSGPLIV